MADGAFDGIVGGGEEAAETEERKARVAAEAFATAIAADHAKYDPEVARAAAEFLRDQSRFLLAQTEELHEQRGVRLQLLEDQVRDGKLRTFAQHMRNGLQVFVALILTGIGVGLALMLIDAFKSQSVIVEPFDAPPALAQRGLMGKVVAGGLLDALTRLQQSTRSSAAQRNLANAWTNDIKVEVPETGVSISDIERALKTRFGHDIHIDGDLVLTDSGGLALTVRGDSVSPKTFEGGASDLGKLTTEAAEYVFGQSQPALYATYLSNADRDADAVAFVKQAYATAGAADRPYLLNLWGISLQNLGRDPRATLPLFDEAIKQNPEFWVAHANIMNVDQMVGDEEGTWREGQSMFAKAGGRPGRAKELDYGNLDLVAWNLLAWRDGIVDDEKAHGGIWSGSSIAGGQIADIDQRLHEPAAAELALQTMPADSRDPTIPAMTHFVHGRMAADVGDTKKAAAEMESFAVDFANPIVSSNYAGYSCWIAPAEEAAGRPDKADAVLKSAGRYVDCYRFRADILDHRGDWAGAQKAYAAAVGIAPDLPAAYYSWGVALVRHGDLSGAEARLAAAHARGPNWADPLKAWGDVLAREGRWKDALAKYNEALRNAPSWAALHGARDAAAKHM